MTQIPLPLIKRRLKCLKIYNPHPVPLVLPVRWIWPRWKYPGDWNGKNGENGKRLYFITYHPDPARSSWNKGRMNRKINNLTTVFLSSRGLGSNTQSSLTQTIQNNSTFQANPSNSTSDYFAPPLLVFSQSRGDNLLNYRENARLKLKPQNFNGENAVTLKNTLPSLNWLVRLIIRIIGRNHCTLPIAWLERLGLFWVS